MSYKKALEVLGISEAILNEERAKILGSLGITAWPSNPQPSRGASSGAFFGQQQLCNNDHQGSSVAPCSTIEVNNKRGNGNGNGNLSKIITHIPRDKFSKPDLSIKDQVNANNVDFKLVKYFRSHSHDAENSLSSLLAGSS